MLYLKKTLLAGAILTALCASAFAAAPADNASQPTMRERVNSILHEDCVNDEGQAPCREQRRRPRLTPEQREKMAQRRAEWKKMTPEQRREAHEKWLQEWQQRAKETMDKLTDAQKAEVEAFIKEDIAQRQERREKLRSMTPEQREAIRANYPHKHNDKRGHRDGFDHGRGFGPRHGSPRPDCPVND